MIKYRELDDRTNPEKIYLFMELCRGGVEELLPEDATGRTEYLRAVFTQLLQGLQYLQTQHVAHHDIKPDNILIGMDGRVRISDFGVAERYDPAIGCSIFYGSPAYQAPEIARNMDAVPYDGHKADIWSAGVVLYQLIIGEMPFKGGNVYLLIKSIDNDPVIIPTMSDKILQDYLASLLEKDPEKRPTATEALNHPWITGKQSVSSDLPQWSCCSLM